MLQHLRLRNVGPAPKLDIDFAPRLNVITGDNRLSKSFLLDIAFWAMTQGGLPRHPLSLPAVNDGVSRGEFR